MFKWFGNLVDSNEKEIKRIQPLVDRINELEPDFEQLNADQLKAKTAEFKSRLASGETLDDILPEAFAAVREAAKRTIKQRHYDVQLMGGAVLHQGKIAEMRTGEGKTLVATLPLYLNALSGKGCHLVTVNDYLARRDPYWMGPIYHALGVTVASIYPQTPDEHLPSRLYDPAYDSGKENDQWRYFRPISRKQAYDADITYGTSSDFGFDYLRDNMVTQRPDKPNANPMEDCVQRPLNYAIVDEVDNLLIDEARTPLIISGPAQESADLYIYFARLMDRLHKDEDYTVDEKDRLVTLTDEGISTAERALQRDGLLKSSNLYDPQNYGFTRYLDSALKAHALYRKDKDYVVKDKEVIIVDEFTGRLMFGRRYSEGIHQAIEAKEGVKVQQETLTYATITIQNYFRMYKKLAGMTGTALTEAEEFSKIYKLEVVQVPTHKEMIREDYPDKIYKDEDAKYRAVVKEVEELHKEDKPVLLGTVSIEKSELLSGMLTRRGIPHKVLNAKQHEKEAAIISQAGEPGMVTVATNMAGRGVDIILGGSQDGTNKEEWQKLHDKVVASGGLHVIGTERHEARRIDNQLRGRAGRQGDPGTSRFFISLEDDIMRRFGGERIKSFMEWAGMDADTPIENALVTRTITDVQKRVEGYHFDVRKHLVEYDDVVNEQRKLIYEQRCKILENPELKTYILSMVKEQIDYIVDACLVFAQFIPTLQREQHYTVDEKRNAVNLTDDGKQKIEDILGKERLLKSPSLDDPANDFPVRYLGSALKAHLLLKKERDIDGLISEVSTIFPLPKDINTRTLESLSYQQIKEKLKEAAQTRYEEKEKELGFDLMRMWERRLMLFILDRLWIEHLTEMERERIQAGWASLQQTRSADAYKNSGYLRFQTLSATIQYDVARHVYHAELKKQEAPSVVTSPMAKVAAPVKQNAAAPKVAGQKVGRNDPCPCGSGKKYKHCCGR